MPKLKKKLSKQVKGQDGLNVLGSSAKNIGIVLASTLLTEIVDLAIERFLHKTFGQNGSPHNKPDSTEAQRSANHNAQAAGSENVVMDSLSNLKERLETIKPDGEELLNVARSQMSHLPPVITEFIEVLKDTVRQKLQESIGVTNQATQLVTESAGHATQAIFRPNEDDDSNESDPRTKVKSETKQKKSKKGKQKKHAKAKT